MFLELAILFNMIHCVEPSTKVVKYKLYISATGRAGFLTKGTTIESSVASVSEQLETTLDTWLLQADIPFKIKFEVAYATELPPGVDLDKCGVDLIQIGDMLNFFNDDDSLTSTIAILSCSADPYADSFVTVGAKVPYVGHHLSTECTTRTIIFLETEQPRFLSVFSTALMRASGIDILNPLSFEEITDGDQGVKYEIRLGTETYNNIMKTNRCFYSV